MLALVDRITLLRCVVTCGPIVIQVSGRGPQMFTGDFNIGQRKPELGINRADVELDDEYASTIHARVSTNGEAWFIEDQGSTNGTWQQAPVISRVNHERRISKGDVYKIGRTLIVMVPA